MAGILKLDAARLKFQISSWLLTLLTTAYILIVFNKGFFQTVYKLNGASGLNGYIYIFCLFLFFLSLLNLALSLFAFPWLLKPVLILLLVSSSIACYFMDAYNILIDTSMVQNAMETDINESTELFSFRLLLFVAATGIAPSLLIPRASINYGSPLRFILTKLAVGVTSVLTIGLIAILFYQDYASLFRNNRYIRDLLVPVNYIHAFNSYSKQFLPENKPVFRTLGDGADLGNSWHSGVDKKAVSVLIVGETARSANFSLFGYPRTTNPELAQENIISFSEVSSCGTSTAVSLPCMFSRFNRADYDEAAARYSENILDVLQKAGLKVVWIDNNSGCKDVCARINNVEIDVSGNFQLCPKDECFDLVLLNELSREIENSAEENIVVVLHQKGSHGPAYYLRAPEEYQKFTPFCHTNQLQECTQTEITNAYDNTILYTDHFVASVIDYLESKNTVFDSSMLYISDHGESLGENNLYLHGLPYFLAPDEQTHVPLVFWMSQSFAKRFGLNSSCLNKKRKETFSHDNLFDSLLGLLDVHTAVYQQGNDLFSSCSSDRLSGVPTISSVPK